MFVALSRNEGNKRQISIKESKMESGPKTRQMFLERAKKAIPLGVNSNFRYWGDKETLIVKK
jgi:hypothetical protein